MYFIEQFGILLIMVMIISFIIKILKQPIIVGYVLAGLIFSYLQSKQYQISDEIISLSDLGIMFLLFLMGLEFDFKSIKYLGKDLFVTTLIQSSIFFMIGFGVAVAFKFTMVESVYTGIVFMFSSTLLVAKWVEDKKESKTLHGKIILGTLIIQDIFAIIAITILALTRQSSLIGILTVPFKGILLFGIAYLMLKYVMNPLLKKTSRYPELMFIFSLSVCFFFVELAALLQYSTSIGAFIGGIVLANTIYKTEIAGRLKPLIIFFNMLFFVGMGFQIETNLSLKIMLFLAVMVALSFILKPVVIFYTLRKRGYDTKTSFFSGIYLAQISEFGIIIVASGMAMGVVSAGINTITIIFVIATMLITSYTIRDCQDIYAKFESKIRKTDRFFHKVRDITVEKDEWDYNVVIFGYHELSQDVISKMKGLNKKIIVVENDPEKVEMLKSDGVKFIFDTASNPELLESLPFEKIDMIISSLTDIEENKLIIRHMKEKNQKAVTIVTARTLKESIELYDRGADYVIFSSYLNNQQVSVLLEDYATDVNKVISKKLSELEKLRQMDKKREDLKDRSNFVDIDTFIKDMSLVNGKGIKGLGTTVKQIMSKKKKAADTIPEPVLKPEAQK